MFTNVDAAIEEYTSGRQIKLIEVLR